MTDTLIAPSSVDLGRRPPGLGRVFFCDLFNGNDNNNGIDPNTPFSTITFALTQCLANRNDYIYVMDGWNEATPIALNIARTHIIGIGNPNLPFVQMTEDGGNDAIFVLTNNGGDEVEIAGFSLGGGNAHGGIECAGGNTTDRAWIHHNTFGSSNAGDTPLYGVHISAAMSARDWLIENNEFQGTSIAGGTITASGILISNSMQHRIRNNIFKQVISPAVSLSATMIEVSGNRFSNPADVAGGAITLDAGCTLCEILANLAAFGETAGALANPFLDNAGANANTWAGNIWHSTMSDPG